MADMEGVFRKMIVLITGTDGQLGKVVAEEVKERGHKAILTNRRNMDITDSESVAEMFSHTELDAVIHCAAYTNVEKAETEKEVCGKVNIIGTENIAKWCEKKNIKMLYVSTDYVFDGKKGKPYNVEEEKCPLNVYGRSKHIGEECVLNGVKKHFVVRTSWVFGNSENDFVSKMCRLSRQTKDIKVVDNRRGRPTYVKDLAEILVDIVETEKYGVYHVANQGECTWYEFAEEIFKQLGKEMNIIPVPAEEFPQKAERPCDSRLDCSVLTERGFKQLPHWKDGLKRYLGGKKMTEEMIREEFIKGYDCSQVVLRAFADKLGLTEDEANRVSACFGGGMMMGEVCGAVTGALMVLGLKYGHSKEENLLDQKEIMAAKSGEFREKFMEKYGTVNCRALLGYDVSKPEELEEALNSGRMLGFCPKPVKDAIDILNEMI